MSLSLALEISFAVVLLANAVWIVIAREAVAAVIIFVAYGLLLAIVWVRLAAPDVALTEAAIGGGVTGVLLLGAAARLRATEATVRPASVSTRLVAAAVCVTASCGIAYVVRLLPDTAPTLAPAAMESLPETGLGNPVAGVLFVYRALDTLLEKAVLLLALVGVWSLAPDRLWGGTPELRAFPRRSSTLLLLARLLPPVGILAGVYMFWVGAKLPGGAFQGGTILAAMWLLVVMTGLEDIPPTSRRWMRFLAIVGPAIFILIGFAGFAWADAFLAYPSGYAKPLIIVIEGTLTLSIAITLGLLAAGPPVRAQQQ
jgi:multisubunit Na+/H+ antiporter MnhB subunit